MKITALIERNENDFYAITSEEEIAGCTFGGYGHSVAEAKADFMESIEEMLAITAEEGHEVPKADDIKVEYTYDLPSFFNDFDWINVTAFAKVAGINESKMRAYKNGIVKASEKTLEKISEAVKTIASALSAASL